MSLGVNLTTFNFLKLRLAFCFLICLSLLFGCATPAKSPETLGGVSFGEKPTNYKKIVKNYIDKKRKGKQLDLSKVHFLNEPNKYVFERLAQEEFGYRVCTLIPIENVNKLRSHFFLIKNGKVIKHLYDSGLISLSRKFCDTELLALEGRSKEASAATNIAMTNTVDENVFKYISCHGKDNTFFFAFNPEKQQLLQLHDGNQIAAFDIQKLSETYIIASTQDSRISINRISGAMIFQGKDKELNGNCELTSKQRF